MKALSFRRWFVCVILLFSFGVTACQPITASTGADSGQLEGLVGSWRVETTVMQQNAVFPALLTFTGDGIVLADEPPSPFETTGHGAWAATGPDTADFTFVALIGSESGALSATLKVAGSLVYDAASDSWSGPFKIWIHDAEGQEILVDDGAFTGARIAVETPASMVFDAFNVATNTHDVAAGLALFANDAVAEFPNQPPPNVYTGTDEIRAWLENDAKDNIHVEIEDAKTAGDTVSATAKVHVDSLPPDLTLVGAVVVTVQDGKITSFRYTLDDETLKKLEALGPQ